MFRALGVTLGCAMLACACSGGGAKPVVANPVCALVLKLGETGRTVAHADVANPDAFDTTMKTAVADYVKTANRLRGAVPARLRDDVDLMVAAAQQYRFSDATASRARVDAYARSVCGTPKSAS